MASIVRELSVEVHFESLARGVLDTRDLLYWASGTFFFLAACLGRRPIEKMAITLEQHRRRLVVSSAAGLS